MTRALAQAVLSWVPAVGLALAAVVATPISLVVAGRTWVESLGVALLIVGSFAILVAPGAHPPGMRRGAQEPYLASMFPGLARRAGDPYPNTRGYSAIFVLTSATLLVVGLLLVV